MKIITLRGLPASGKTTWAKDFCKKNKDWVRINRDDLREMRGEYWIPKQEKMITKWENSLIEIALEHGNNVILDATNLNVDRNRARIDKLKILFPELKNETKFFDISLDDSLNRDRKRANPVGESSIRRMYERYFGEIKMVYQEDDRLPHCVIFDVDGTLAKMDGRSPFDWSKVSEDKPNIPIITLAKMYHQNGKKIIIFTGRNESAFEDTKLWLNKYEIPFENLFIRPEGNVEKDSIVKKRIFEEEIRGKYFCELVIDDRDQVVRMWREELGLTCLQVDYGNF